MYNLPVCFLIEKLLHNKTSSSSLGDKTDSIEEKRKAQILYVETQQQGLANATKDFKLALKNNADELIHQQTKKQKVEKEIQEALQEVDRIQQETIKKEKYQDQLKAAIQGCEERNMVLEIMKNKLKDVTSKHEIEGQCKDSSTSILQTQKWEESQRRELNIEKVRVS